MARYDVTVVCKDCDKEIYDHYEMDEIVIGSESVSCGSPQCEDDTKVILEYGFADTLENGTESGQIWIGRK